MAHDERQEIVGLLKDLHMVNEDCLRLIRDIRKLLDAIEGDEAEEKKSAKELYLEQF